MVRPFTTLCILAAVGALSLLLMFFFPESGLNVGGHVFRFKSIHSFIDTARTHHIDVDALLAEMDSTRNDSTVVDSTMSLVVVREVGKVSLQFYKDDSSPMFPFFEALHEARDQGADIHVLHYGDSQIEADRISSYLRNHWQSDFGGSGPGLLSPVPLTSSDAVVQKRSDNWKRHTAYGFDDGKSNHQRFGILASYGTFDCNGKDSTEATLEFISQASSAVNKKFNRVKLFLRASQECSVSCFVNDSIFGSKKILPQDDVSAVEWSFGFFPKKVKLVFKAMQAPDVQAVLLDALGGVKVDNVAMRGCDGNIFRKIDSQDILSFSKHADPALIILQYGGNALPYIDDETEAKRYGNYFESQIQQLKSWFPKASFLVIGPSDMSTTVEGELQTWPMLEPVRDALKNAAFNQKCAFWDMYEVMGGYNSMLDWVSHDPPYAGPDYTHFTPLGARKIAELLYKSIQQDYDSWHSAVDSASPPAGK
jgi:lysophospholipase L1-like esterase